MKTRGIYLIKNSVNGRFYIGSSINVKSRWASHKSTLRRGIHHSPKLQRAWNKYGEDSFEFHLIEIVEDGEDLASSEQRWMDALGAAVYGYNISPKAGSVFVSSGRPLSSEHRAKIGRSRRGKGHSEETRRLMSEKARQRVRAPMSAETKQKIGSANKGRKLPPISEETKRKLSEAAKLDWAKRKLKERKF